VRYGKTVACSSDSTFRSLKKFIAPPLGEGRVRDAG
jgi:hypothetical protein